MTVLYTALFGGSDRLKPAPPGPDRALCFTDQADLTGGGWTFVYQPRSAQPRVSARHVKLSADALFPNADVSVWIDASITLTDWTGLLTDAGGAEVACLAHPDRSTCYAEGETVIRLRIASPARIREALGHYREAGFAPPRLSTTGLLVRRHTPAVAAFNARWREQLDRYGTNDQVHVDYCAWQTGVTVRHLPGDYRANRYMVYDQVDHHARRRPQFLREAECVRHLA